MSLESLKDLPVSGTPLGAAEDGKAEKKDLFKEMRETGRARRWISDDAYVTGNLALDYDVNLQGEHGDIKGIPADGTDLDMEHAPDGDDDGEDQEKDDNDGNDQKTTTERAGAHVDNAEMDADELVKQLDGLIFDVDAPDVAGPESMGASSEMNNEELKDLLNSLVVKWRGDSSKSALEQAHVLFNIDRVSSDDELRQPLTSQAIELAYAKLKHEVASLMMLFDQREMLGKEIRRTRPRRIPSSSTGFGICFTLHVICCYLSRTRRIYAIPLGAATRRW